MTKEEVRQQAKATAINKIRKLYNSDNIVKRYTYYPGDGSMMEQRDGEVEQIIKTLEKELESNK